MDKKNIGIAVVLVVALAIAIYVLATGGSLLAAVIAPIVILGVFWIFKKEFDKSQRR